MSDESQAYKERISQDAAVMVGKPVIRGTRMPVEWILDWLSANLDLEEFFAAYPEMTVEDIQAAIALGRDAVRADYLRSRHRKEAFAAARRRRELAAAKA